MVRFWAFAPLVPPVQFLESHSTQDQGIDVKRPNEFSSDRGKQPSAVSKTFDTTDVLATIFENVRDFSTMLALAFTSPRTLQVFNAWPRKFVAIILQNMPAEMRRNAVAIVARDEMAVEDYNPANGAANRFREYYLGAEVRQLPKTITSPIGALSKLAVVSSAAESLTVALAESCMRNVPVYNSKVTANQQAMEALEACTARSRWWKRWSPSQPEQPPQAFPHLLAIPHAGPQHWEFPLKAFETHRIQRAFWSLATYCELFCETDPWEADKCFPGYPIFERENYSFEQVKFLRGLQPWEVEELVTVHLFLFRILCHVYVYKFESLIRRWRKRTDRSGRASVHFKQEDRIHAARRDYGIFINNKIMTLGLPGLYQIYCQTIDDPFRFIHSKSSPFVNSTGTSFFSGAVDTLECDSSISQDPRQWPSSSGLHSPSAAIRSLGLQFCSEPVRIELRDIGYVFWDR